MKGWIRTTGLSVLLLGMAMTVNAQDWTPLGGPNGGSVVQLHQAADGTLYASTATAGLFVSNDGGESWTATSYSGPEQAMLAESPSGTMVMANPGSADIYLSADQFASWDAVAGPGGVVEALFVLDDNTMIAAERSSGALKYHRTTDGGGSWSEVLNVGFLGNNIGWATDGSTIYMYHSLGVVPYRSTDDGATWTELANPGGGAGVDMLGVAADGSVIAARGGALHRSTDMGDSWTETGTVYLTVSDVGVGPDGLLMLHTTALESELRTSSDNGASWSTMDSPFSGNASVPQVLGTSDGFWLASASGIHHSTDDGATWTEQNDGLTAETVLGMSITAGGNVSVGTQSGAHHMYIDGTWSRSSHLANYSGRNVSGTLYTSAIYDGGGKLFRSYDDGATWEQAADQPTFTVGFKVFDSPGSDIYAFTHGTAPQSLRRSSDDGDTWTDLEPVVPTDMAYSGGGNIYVTTSWEGLGKSTDGGATWTFTPGANLKEVVLAPDGTLLVNGSNYLLRSTDDGATLEDITSNPIPDIDFPAVTINAVGVDGSGTFYVDLDWVVTWPEYQDGGGVYISEDGGDTFTVSDDFRARLFQLGRNGQFYAATNLGVMVLGGADVEDDMVAGTPLTFSLAQNFPNPFNPSTTIAFTLPAPGHTELVVVDLLGRRVAELVGGTMSAGAHQVTFNASHLASGPYLYTLTGPDGATATGRMLLVK